MTRRHGLTLVETLLALALIAMLTIPLVSWTTGAQHLSVRLGETVGWTAAANATLDLIGDDLVSFDVVDDERPSIQFDSNSLRLSTRVAGVGSAEVVYVFDDNTGLLTRQVGAGMPRLLVGAVSSLTITPFTFDDNETPDEAAAALHITLTNDSGFIVDRTLGLHDRGVNP